MREVQADIVIVGSGAGGGTVAKELAPLCADGVRIVVFEQGPKLKDEELTGREIEMASRLYFDSGGMLTHDRSMTLAWARAYGGSTTVYTGTSMVVPEHVLKKWDVPGLAWDDVRRRSEKALAENNVHLLEDELINENNRLFVAGCRALGYRVQQFPINVKGCHGAGVCNLGCPNGAKQGTNRVQLPLAERQGVQVVTNATVTSVAKRMCTVRVRSRKFGEPSAWEPGEYIVKARIIVVAGNAINSPALLFRSGLGEYLPALGRGITLHPALILAAQHDHPLTNFFGFPKSYYSDQFRDDQRFLLETCMYYPFTTAKNLNGFGEEHEAMMRHLQFQQQILVLALDEPLETNRVEIGHHGEPVVRYRLAHTVLDSLHRAMIEAARIFFAAGASRVHVPAAETFFVKREDQDRLEALVPRANVRPGGISISSAHLMGGCRMGADEKTSVTDAWGQVHGFPWLFIADSSLFPRCSEVNPYVTVMALADRVAERVRERFKELGS